MGPSDNVIMTLKIVWTCPLIRKCLYVDISLYADLTNYVDGADVGMSYFHSDFVTLGAP